ncbi:SusC/RagA family TonB-linked outer membrane protein [Mucilaginibacter paludis]|uniref:TonB-dependent receptor plug n=1 Tax=Mucilaginibacter paludis DSM 18603 TaxID=714943 RepID=H1YBM0_9SPHI|nr:SusC/RagA family TonB-linked outer membrane protein [Mucilaginibacter paludis]EHQ25091.1 TonB-dependent receptor plug [Mucilaginibacter paludis DSM 18603]
MKQLLLTILIGFAFYISYAQQHALKGTVISAADKQPLSGATLTIQESRQIATTDKNGNFTIATLLPNLTLSISYIGFQSQEIKVSLPVTSAIMITLLPKTSQLSEVTVSTGYQTLPKERATGSFEQLDKRILSQQVSPDILSRLPAIANSVIADRTTGGSNGRLMIRGLSTIQGPKDPLVIVDNFPYDGNISNINPNDVESVTILKDAAAASIWGAQAGNGVVVITTKKGRFNQPLTVTLNSNLSISRKPDLSYIPQISSSDFIDVEEMLFGKGYYKSQINSSSHPALSPVIELLNKETNGTLSAAAANSQINALRNVDVRNDFSKYFYQPAVNQQYALSLEGGTKQMAWTATGGYDKDISNLDARYDRLNLRFQNKYQVYKDLQITSGIWFTQSNTISGKPGYGDIIPKSGYYLYPYAQLADANGNPIALTKDYEQTYLSTAGNGKLLDWNYYPLTDYQHATTTTGIADVVANAGVNCRIWKGLNADVKYQFERQQTTTKSLWDQNSYFARDLVNRFTQINSAGVVTNNIPAGGITDLSDATLKAHDLRGQLNFTHTWGVNDISALAGGELRSAHTISDRNRFYGYNDDLLTYGNVNYTTQYPNFITGSNALIPDNRDISDQITNYVSYFANAAYTYRSKYIISVSGRRDASNLFGLNTNDQWNPFWSAGASWNLSDESFYHSELLPYLRLRATYGYSGNINPALVAANTIAYYSGTSPYTSRPYARFSNYYNPDLKWENSRMINIAADFHTKGNRISGSLEVYQKKGTDLFGTAILDYTAGIGTQIVKNVASMKGKGIDLQLKTINLEQKIKWYTTLNFSYYKDQVVDYYLKSLQGSNFISYNNNVTVSGLKGYPVYGVFAYKSAGLDPQTGDPRGYLNGQVSKDYTAITGSGTQVGDLQYFGSAIPTGFGSVINTFSYGHLTLDFDIVYKLGYYFRKTSINYSSLYSTWLGNSDYANRWQKPGDERTTNVPSMVYPASSARDNFYAGSASLVEKGDHIRLQYINLGYELNKEAWHQLPFKSVQVYLNISNLGIIWRANKSGIDPDYYNSTYPLNNPVTFAFGLKTTF